LNMNENDLLAKAAAIEGDIRTLVISVENVLEVLYAHLQPSAQHGDDDSIVAPSGELNTGKRSQELGLLASFMVPALQSLVEMDKPTLGLETEFLSMIATRVRDAIAAQPNAMSRSRFGIA
jgi:nuclear pore complex protein Nup205